MIEAYQGEEPYLFVSYAHADSKSVFGEIERLTKLGVRVWYDEGIDAGNDWPDEIGRSLASASLFVVFISPRSVVSKNVQNEINFALNRNKPFLAIHLEETQLPVGLELRMGDIQALTKYRMAEGHYARKLERVLPWELRMVETAKSTIPVKRVAVPLRGAPARSLCLHAATRNREQDFCITADCRCTLGKDRANDFVLRVLPRSPDNDLQSRRISGRHAEVSIDPQSAVWTNGSCRNGTRADGRDIGPNEETVLNGGMLLRPANVLTLHVDVFDSNHFNGPVDLSALINTADSDTPATIPEGQINTVALRRMDNFLDREQYVLIHRGALLGRGPACALRLDDPSLSNRHAKLYHLQGGLWIEPMDAASVVVVDGIRLGQDDVAAVTPGTEILCGSVTIRVTQKHQQELGYLDTSRHTPSDGDTAGDHDVSSPTRNREVRAQNADDVAVLPFPDFQWPPSDLGS